MDSVKNIFGNTDIVGTEGNATFSFVLGNFKGDLKFDKSSHYSSSRSSSLFTVLKTKIFPSLGTTLFILMSFAQSSIWQWIKLNLYAVGNFSEKFNFLIAH